MDVEKNNLALRPFDFSSSRDSLSYKAVIFPSVCFTLMMRSFQTVGSFVVNLLYHKFRRL